MKRLQRDCRHYEEGKRIIDEHSNFIHESVRHLHIPQKPYLCEKFLKKS